jgi:DNA-binding response OmpR family regulator
MWILVMGEAELLEEADGALSVLRELGCRVRGVDVRDSLSDPSLASNPPAAVLVEAHGDMDAARAALKRVRGSGPLAEVPTIVGVKLALAQRCDGTDGFDDFVLVPYIPAEVYVRIRRIERRRSEFAGQEIIKFGPMTIDLAAHEVTVDGRRIEMTNLEFMLLRFLCQNRGRVFSREQLLARVWGANYANSRTVDMHMRRLRMKLSDVNLPIETVRGVGYKLRAS